MPPSQRPPCPVCHATRFRKRDGVLYCERGHQIQGYFDAEGDDVEVGRALGRRLYTRKGRRTKAKSKVGVVYGTEGQYLAYEALQCAIAMQRVAMCERFGLGDEFQVLCHDLWLLFAQSHRLQAADPAVASTTTNAATTVGGSQGTGTIHDMIYGAGARSGLDLSDVDEDEEDDEQEDPEEDTSSKKPRPARIKYEAGGGGDEAVDAQSNVRVTSRRKTTGQTLSTDFISLPLAPCILYIACLHLRVPLLLADIHRLCASNEIPYLTSYDSLPKHLQNALMNPFHHALQPWYLPTTTRLRTITADLAHIYQEHYSLTTPSPMASPLYLRLAVEWNLGPSFAQSATALAAALRSQSKPGTFLSWADAQIPNRDPRPGDLRVSLTDPEITLVAIAMKCALLMLIPSSPSALTPSLRQRAAAVNADQVYGVSKHDPPVSFQGLVRWATEDAKTFARFARDNLPVFGAVPPLLPFGEPLISGSAVSAPTGKWAEVSTMLEGLLKTVDAGATKANAADQASTKHHGVVFPLSIPQHGDLAASVQDWPEEQWMQHVWTLAMSVARCSREELEPVYEHVVELLRKSKGTLSDPILAL